MKEYNKQQLHEYAKELFALCLEKGLRFEYNPAIQLVTVFAVFEDDAEYVGYSYMEEYLFKHSIGHAMPIWELIGKVKQL